jgi:hypothetical protein
VCRERFFVCLSPVLVCERDSFTQGFFGFYSSTQFARVIRLKIHLYAGVFQEGVVWNFVL